MKGEQMRRLVWLAVFFCFTQSYAGSNLPETLINAKTAYLRNDGAEGKDFEKFCALIREWGRFEIVEFSDKADVRITLSTQLQFKTVRMPSTGGGLGGINSQQVITSYLRIINVKDDVSLYSDQIESKNPKGLVQKLKSKLKNK